MWKNRMNWPLRLVLGFLLVLSAFQCGCVPHTWSVVSCDQRPPEDPSKAAIVLLHTRVLLAFRICSIDGHKVEDAIEYHLAPGEHVIVAGISRGESDEVSVRCTLREGSVYRLTADVWNLSNRFSSVPLAGPFQRIECDWRPRLLELGRFEELTAGKSVDWKIIEHIRARPVSLMVLARQNTVGIDEAAGTHAHFTATGHLATMPIVPVETPPKYWGALPPNLLFAREGTVRTGS